MLAWRQGPRWAWLYRLDLATASRPASPAKLNALDKAIAARQTCRQCRQRQDYCVPRSDGRCHECMTGTGPNPMTAAVAVAAVIGDLIGEAA